MNAVFNALDIYEPLIYILLSLVAWLALRSLWRAWEEYRAAAFRLEKEVAMRRLANRVGVVFLVVLLFAVEFVVANFVLPGLPDFDIPPLVGNNNVTPGVTMGPDGTPTIVQPPLGSRGCFPGQLLIDSPRPGQDIQGRVDVTGTVDIPNFGFYKYEYAPLNSEIWTTISAGRTVVRNDLIGRWDTTELTPGDYSLRVVVTDNTGTEQDPCIINVRVLAP